MSSNEIVKLESSHPEHPRNLIPELCKQFYHLGWVTGTGGGMTIKLGDEIYIAPSGNVFRIAFQEMIKGTWNSSLNRYNRYDEELVVPIIENTPNEADLKSSLELALVEFPAASAVLVRRHGVYVWGADWKSTKTQTECYDYLFELAVSMKQLGLSPLSPP
uniref:Probable methylthioribulose-1-phosphate dehydratase n=1 Tax=Cacopsylla melanoneura TaxID=428564 RepID=A0A8D8YA49_9HEMI